ncbi:MAG TPA: hypothetical protein VFP20_10965 [Bacteroidales bacterium]|nr:hypothetical protein [Bacteroidales bacterium]
MGASSNNPFSKTLLLKLFSKNLLPKNFCQKTVPGINNIVAEQIRLKWNKKLRIENAYYRHWRSDFTYNFATGVTILKKRVSPWELRVIITYSKTAITQPKIAIIFDHIAVAITASSTAITATYVAITAN